MKLGVAAGAAGLLARNARADDAPPADAPDPGNSANVNAGRLESYLTPQARFQDVSRGTPLPHALPDEKKTEVGLTRDTWKLEVIADPEVKTSVRRPMTKEAGTALDFAGLMQLAEKRTVRFAKVMTCLNLGCPLGMGIWEGVPLRDIVWAVRPGGDVRRVFYYGYHNDAPEQIFQSSLPIGRVFEDPFDLPPVIACFKLNGEFLTPERGGPVRIVVPEGYGFKCIKWLSHVVLTNRSESNDTYAKENNDVDSPLKTFAATIKLPRTAKADEPIAVTGYAQVGVSGLSKVQTWLQKEGERWSSGDQFFESAPWVDAEMLPAPTTWPGLPDEKVPPGTHGFDDATGQPRAWPLRLAMVHWQATIPGLPAGKHTFRCRTVDEHGIGQPLPRPFRKSGWSQIEQATITVA